MGTKFSFLVSILASLLFAGCGSSERKTHSLGFHFPEGDPVVGRQLFVKFDCHYCHAVSGVALPDSGGGAKPPPIMLGGEVNRVRSYGELVTSIIDPDHVISSKYKATLSEEEKKMVEMGSPMPGYNEEMTIAELVDLAAFLHSRYQLIEPTYDEFYYTTP